MALTAFCILERFDAMVVGLAFSRCTWGNLWVLIEFAANSEPEFYRLSVYFTVTISYVDCKEQSRGFASMEIFRTFEV